jgi:hypothetical protein
VIARQVSAVHHGRLRILSLLSPVADIALRTL